MLKKTLGIVAAALLLLAQHPFAVQAAYSYEVQTAKVVQTVNFRTAPCLSAASIRYLQTGENLDLLDQPNSYWLHVKDSSGTEGYVTTLPKYIQLTAKTVSPEANGKVLSSVSFRTGPSTANQRIRYLKADEPLWILEKVNDYWYKAADNDSVIGYVSTLPKFIETSFTHAQNENPAPIPAETSASPDSGGTVSADLGGSNAEVLSSVSFRTGAGTSFARIRYLQPGETLLILEKVNDYWYKAIDQDQVTGYVTTLSKYIDTVFGQSPDQPEEQIYKADPNGQVTSSVSFRTGPSVSSGRIRYLQAGEPLWIMDQVNSYWYKVKDQNDVAGYVTTMSQYIDSHYVQAYKQMDPAEAAQKVIDAGMKYLGTPYEFGSSRSDTSTFDCSDFVRQAFLDGIGLQLPGDSRSQAGYIQEMGKVSTDWHTLKPGDLMFFMGYKGYRASDYEGIDKTAETVRHVGIYLGDGKILHTYSVQSGGVKISNIANSQWELRFMFGGSAN